MKTETLEALVLDRALGELSPEVGELLDAYLAQEPGDAARAARWTTATRLARTAETIADSAEPLPGWRAPRQSPRWAAPRELLRLAACLALGGGVGWSLGAGNLSPRPAIRSVASSPVASVAHVPAPHNAPRRQAPEFWSIAAFAHEGAPESAIERTSYRLRWDSPAKLPHLEEKP